MPQNSKMKVKIEIVIKIKLYFRMKLNYAELVFTYFCYIKLIYYLMMDSLKNDQNIQLISKMDIHILVPKYISLWLLTLWVPGFFQAFQTDDGGNKMERFFWAKLRQK